MKPSIGRIVHYRLTDADVKATNARRDDARRNREAMQEARPGFQAHIGNAVTKGEIVALLVTKIWPNEFGVDHDGVSGQAFLDGNDSLWVTSRQEGTGPGTWSWPERV